MATRNLLAFQQMVQRNDFLVLDTETTGLHSTAEIVQIAIVDAQDNVLLDTLVKPVHRIPRDVIRIHGITNDQVRDVPTWAEITTTVADLLRDRDLVVYNAAFDHKMLNQSAAVAQLPRTNWKSFSRWWCAMNTYAEYYAYRQHRRKRNYKLTVAAQHCGIATTGAHNALADSRMTLQVVKAMAKSAF